MTTWQNKVLELEERGWSLTALAKATGASIGAISDLKQGRTKEPRANVALELHALHCSGALPAGQCRADDGGAIDAKEHSGHIADAAFDRVIAEVGETQIEGAVGLHGLQHRRIAGTRA